jgi:hypothetical protein
MRAGRLSSQQTEPDMTFDDKREQGFEKRFALDEEQKFKAETRRNKLLGLWAAEKLGLSGDAAITYAREVVAADFDEGGHAGMVRKVNTDLAAKGIAVTDAQIRAKMDALIEQAAAEVKAAG